MLLNLVRLRYNDSPLFLELGAIVAQYGYDASFSAGGQISGAGSGSATLGTGLGYSEKPTVTYTPLSGDEFAERMLAPIPLDSIMLFSQSGWSAERLLLVAVERMNDVLNALTAAGPTPEQQPDYESFADLADRYPSAASRRADGPQLGAAGAREPIRPGAILVSGYGLPPIPAVRLPPTSSPSVAPST